MKITRIKVANERKYTKDVDELISLVMQDVPASLNGGMQETSFARFEIPASRMVRQMGAGN
jgi:hypothetical protein